MPAADFGLLAQFERIDLVYKTIETTPLSAAVLVPKSLISQTTSPDSPRSVPVLVHFHGGALITGTNLDPAILSRWSAAPLPSRHSPPAHGD